MSEQDFSVHVDPDELARLSVTPAAGGGKAAGRSGTGSDAAHHGTQDERMASRQRSERDRAGRAAGATRGRSYAFRRS